MIVGEGDAQLLLFDLMPEKELWRLTGLLKQIAKANFEAPEPPEKWAVINRFRVAHEKSPLIVEIRELLMYLLPTVTIHISLRRVRILDRLELFGMCLVR